MLTYQEWGGGSFSKSIKLHELAKCRRVRLEKTCNKLYIAVFEISLAAWHQSSVGWRVSGSGDNHSLAVVGCRVGTEVDAAVRWQSFLLSDKSMKNCTQRVIYYLSIKGGLFTLILPVRIVIIIHFSRGKCVQLQCFLMKAPLHNTQQWPRSRFTVISSKGKCHTAKKTSIVHHKRWCQCVILHFNPELHPQKTWK